MFDDFDLYETCEEYYEGHIIDSYQYYLMNENPLINENEDTYSNHT